MTIETLGRLNRRQQAASERGQHA